MEQNRKTILSGEIKELMYTIREQFDILNSYDGKIPVLEFDILKDNIRRLYEELIILQKENDRSAESSFEQPGITAGTFQPVRDDQQLSEPEPPTDEIPAREIEGKVEPAAAEEEPAEVDLFSSERSAFNEKLKEAREQSLGPRTGESVPSDIKSLININDKFLFINDLFDGDFKEYTHAIEIFNNFDEKGEAFNFLDSLLKDNLWNSTSPAFLKLKEIVEKRFI